ncbi:MAG TPA: glutathione S-transferase family protein [Solirubrobacteraceae bacterium]|nr:glutathione S-transferase family protein [Solirubrobacteraceae bacterium]
MRVYHREHTGRPLRVLWTLEELGQPYELVAMTYEQGKSEEHFARHPLGRVPVLEDDEGYVFESAAICMHVADLFPEGAMMPPVGTHDRALAYQWAVFAPSEIEPPLIEAAIFAEADPDRSAKAKNRFSLAAAAVAGALDGCVYLVGDRLTVADVMISSALNFTSRAGFGELLEEPLKEYVARLRERPAFQRAQKRLAELPTPAE